MSSEALARSEPEVLWELQDAVATITLNRPHARNAQTAQLDLDLMSLLARADADPEVRAVVLTGAGSTFCVGADISYIEEFKNGFGSGTSIPHPLAAYAAGVRKPVIAALNGSTAGIGLVFAISCDLRYIASGAKISTAFVRRGLVAERSLGWHLPRVVGHSAAMDLALSGRVITADEALQIGLVNRVLPPEEVVPAALAWARDVAANCAPAAVAATKAQLNRSLTQDLNRALRDADAYAVSALRGADVSEGVNSFREKRLPHFAPLGLADDADVHIQGPDEL